MQEHFSNPKKIATMISIMIRCNMQPAYSCSEFCMPIDKMMSC
jgi:hypothetical protein